MRRMQEHLAGTSMFMCVHVSISKYWYVQLELCASCVSQQEVLLGVFTVLPSLTLQCACVQDVPILGELATLLTT